MIVELDLENNTKINKKFIVTAILGNLLEYIDFMTFILISPILIDVFFPRNNSRDFNLTVTSLIVLTTYIMRPIGGMILGNIGDQYGRKSAFSLTLLLMASASLVIGFLPTYSHIGYFATFILILMRILQGGSMGGEVPGSITYVAENSRHTNYFFMCALLTFGANIGIAISGQLINFFTMHTSQQFMHSFGWRIIFIGGGIIAIFGYYIRFFAPESEEFIKTKHNNQINKAPFAVLIKNYSSEILGGCLLCIIVSLSTSIFHIFLPSILVTFYSFNSTAAINLSSLGAVIMACFSLIFGYLAKYVYPMKIVRLSIFGLIIVFGIVLFYGSTIISEKHDISYLYEFMLIISILIAGVNGLFFGLLADLFPVGVRYSGISICYNFAYIIGAGLAPIWTNALIHMSSYKYVIAVCLIFLLCFSSMFKPKTYVAF